MFFQKRQNMFIVFSTILLCLSFIMTSSVYSQLGLDKLKKKVEGVAESKPGGISKNEANEIVQQAYYSINPVNSIRSVYPGMFAEKGEAQRFYDNCNKIDYINKRKEIEKLGEQFPDFKKEGMEMASEYKTFVTGFPKHLEELFTDYIANEINSAIEKAYSLKAKAKSNIGNALEAAEAGLLTVKGILLIIPEHSDALKLQKDAQDTVDKIRSEYDALVFTSDFHKQNAGKIVFSKLPIDIKKENPDAMSSKFVAGDYIYGMMYFKGTFQEVTSDYNMAVTVIWVNGQRKVDFNFKLDGEKRQWTYLNNEIVPEPIVSKTRGAKVYTKALSELSPRVHKIKVTLEKSGGTEPIAEGEFELDCTQGLEKIAEIAKELELKSQSQVTMPSPAQSNPELEKAMLEAIKNAGWKETPLKAVIIDKDWNIHRNILGVILFRSIRAEVAVKTPEGICRLFSLSFNQNYDGKSYGKTELYGVGGSQDMPCENVK